MKKNYYLVPVTESLVYLNGKPLIELLKNIDNTLYKRENERIGMIYSVPMNRSLSREEKEKINNFNQITSNLYHLHGVPEKIIVYGNCNGLYELYTGKKVECSDIGILGVRAVDQLVIEFFLNDNSLYGTEVTNFINNSRSNIIDFNKAKKLLNHRI